MNKWLTPSGKQMNMKVMYLALALSVAVIVTGGIIDSSHVFGKQGTLPIQIFVSVISGVMIGIGWVSSKTGMKLMELI